MQRTVQASQRVGLYIRVSTEEQALRGYSLEAQRETLETYAKSHGMIIVDFYQDEGKSARKPYRTRPECMRLLRDVEAGRIDLILFIKLDRWFRNVGDYYEVQKILDAHGVHWQAVLEDYETVTSSGQFKVNIMLSVAQNEADRTSERIRVVVDSKIKHGTVVSGHIPFGYRIGDDKRLEIVPEHAAIVRDVFETFTANASQRATLRHVQSAYGLYWCFPTIKRILRCSMYIGRYDRNGRVNNEYCPPIISQELFESAQRLLEFNVKAPPSGRTYLFSSMLVCDECGHKLSAMVSKGRIYYRCPHFVQRSLCTHNRSCPERMVEEWLFEHLSGEIECRRVEWEAREAERRKAESMIDRSAVKRKLSRLKELYLNEVIDIEEYRRDYELYMSQLAERPATRQDRRPDFETAQALVSKGYRSVYDSLPREEQRALWHSVIKEIRINSNIEVTGVVFL